MWSDSFDYLIHTTYNAIYRPIHHSTTDASHPNTVNTGFKCMISAVVGVKGDEVGWWGLASGGVWGGTSMYGITGFVSCAFSGAISCLFGFISHNSLALVLVVDPC